jgi:hypothetical protein
MPGWPAGAVSTPGIDIGNGGKVRQSQVATLQPERHTISRTPWKREGRTRLSLEMNSETVMNAVEACINYRASDLFRGYEKALARRRDNEIQEMLQSIQTEVLRELMEKADGTFLWVSLVFR